MGKLRVHSNKFYFLLTIFIVTTIIAVTFIINNLNQPSKGDISYQPNITSNSSSQQTFNSTKTNVVGKYIKFSYPASLKAYPLPKPVYPAVEAYSDTYKDTDVWTLALQVVHIPSGDINDNSGYTLRKSNPNRYGYTIETINQNKVYIFTDTQDNNFNKVAFMVNGEYQASISLTGLDINQPDLLQTTFDQVVSSFEWRV